MSQDSEELPLEDCVVPLSLAQLSKEEGSVIDHAHRSTLSPVLKARALTECLLASAEPPAVMSWFYSTSGDFLREVCWEEAVV